jgi:hypothetical protein
MSILLLLLVNLSWEQKEKKERKKRTQDLQINITSDDLLTGAIA